jgi:TatD DNase family protein
MLVDMHVHCTELKNLESYSQGYLFVCVAEDVETSRAVVELSRRFHFIKPCVGIHPWNIARSSIEEARILMEQAVSDNVKCVGEVGLDSKFVPETLTRQREVFKVFLDYAKEYDLVLNLHTAGTHREVFQMLKTWRVEKAYFHWYTGPEDLIKELADSGYFIGVNPAWKIQEKHYKIISKTPLDGLLTESDAPYQYRGLSLKPELVSDSLDLLARLHNLDRRVVEEKIGENFKRVFKQ